MLKCLAVRKMAITLLISDGHTVMIYEYPDIKLNLLIIKKIFLLLNLFLFTNIQIIGKCVRKIV